MKKIIQFLMLTLCVLFISDFSVGATEGESIKENVLLEITQEARLYEGADETSTVIATLPEGTAVFSKEASDGEWIKITYQGTEGYTLIQNVQKYSNAELNQEFEQIAMQNELLANELEFTEVQQRQKKTWGLAIGALVVAIFAVSIASAVLKNINDMDKKRKLVKKSRRRR